MIKSRLIALTMLIFMSITATVSGANRPALKNTVTITQGAIRQILDDYIAHNKEFMPQGEIRFKRINLPQPFKLPKGNLKVEVIPSDPSIIKSHHFTLLFRVNGRVEKNIAIRGELEAIAPVVVAAGDIRRNAIIEAEDLQLVKFNIKDLRNPTFNMQDVIGMRLKRSVRQGNPIDNRLIDYPPIIHRDEIVTITVRKGALTITARGIARQDAQKGAIIRVRNTSSKKEILCRVIAPGHVQVEI